MGAEEENNITAQSRFELFEPNVPRTKPQVFRATLGRYFPNLITDTNRT